MPDPIRILYVDDEPDLLEIGKVFLESTAGYVVDTLTSAVDAIATHPHMQYDAIISDYQMPGIDGIAFLKHVRASGDSIPFILFTGRGREEVVIQALNEGADFYLQKGGENLHHRLPRSPTRSGKPSSSEGRRRDFVPPTNSSPLPKRNCAYNTRSLPQASSTSARARRSTAMSSRIRPN